MSQIEFFDLRLSPAEPHFPILFPIAIQSECFISFRKYNRHHYPTPKILLLIRDLTLRHSSDSCIIVWTFA